MITGRQSQGSRVKSRGRGQMFFRHSQDKDIAMEKITNQVVAEVLKLNEDELLAKSTGKIKDTSATVKVDYDNQTALFRGQILTTNMSQGGDSGSLVLDMKARAVGLLFAGSEQVTIINPINEVLRLLDIELVS